MTIVLVAVAAGIGTLTRVATAGRFDQRLPVGTLAVNTIGSFVLGRLVASGSDALTVLGTGGLGALTTWSAVAVGALARPGSAAERALVTSAMIALPVAAAWLGLASG
ncbi:MAG: CrcB family protein [Actinomycetota bacterium]